MIATTILRQVSISVIDRRCRVAPADEPFVELHRDFSVSYVRKGSFGYRSRGESFEPVADRKILQDRLAARSLG